MDECSTTETQRSRKFLCALCLSVVKLVFVCEEYSNLLGDVDSLAEQLTKRYRSQLACRAGCSSCCGHDLSIFEAEAAAVRSALPALPIHVRERVIHQARLVQARKVREEYVACPLLVDDLCAIYDARPIICRTQGLPLLYTAEDGRQEVDYCRLNFTRPAATQDLDPDHLVQLDELNFKLAVTNLRYCRNLGILPAESGNRKPMSAIILEAEEPPDNANLE